MRKFISNTALVAIASSGMLFASCSDHDMFNPNYKADEYAANWEQKIGKVDPNQDWSMATKVTAKANVPGATSNSVLSIYTENPVHSTAKLLATTAFSGNSASVAFNALKGADQVFVTVKENGKNLVYGYADIVNGTVDAGKTVAKKATRATGVCPVIKGESTNIFHFKTRNPEKDIVTTETYFMKDDDSNSKKTYEEWVVVLKNAMEENKKEGFFYSGYPYCPFVKESVVTYNGKEPWEEGFAYTYHPESEWELADGWSYKEVETGRVEGYDELNIDVTMLNGVEKKAVQTPWTLAWGIELFGKGGFFEEQVKYYRQSKLNLMSQIGTTLEDVEKGFSITSSGGEITLPFMYGATNIADRFGYVYYKDGEDPLAQPHYILMNDGKPSSNIYLHNWGGIAVDNMQLPNLVGVYGAPGDPNTEVYGTEYKLTYFDEAGNATYDFPAGYHIVFFIAPFNGTNYTTGDFNYSLPELNKRVNHTDWETENPNYNSNRGAIKATAWKYNGNVFLGFEDGGRDEDLNDIVFWVEGDFTPDQKVPEVPSSTETKTEATSWILACEDLGDTDDYDFNDIVLEIRRVDEITTETSGDGKTTTVTGENHKVQVRCLAAGGTLPAHIYYKDKEIGESHALLGGQTSQMINTYSFGKASDWITIEENVDKDWTLVARDFSIEVGQKDDNMGSVIITAPQAGTAPQMIVVPGDWEWPSERTKIQEAYPNFANWNGNASFTGWNETKVSNLVIKH